MIAHHRYQYFTHTWLKLGCDQLLYFKRVEKKVLRRHQMKLSKGGLFFYEVTSKLSRLSSRRLLRQWACAWRYLPLVVGGQLGNEDSVMWSLITIRQHPPPHSLFSPSTSNGEPISIHTPPGQTTLIPEKSISTSFQLTWHRAARVSQLEPLRPVDARCWKMRLYGCISVWLTLLWDAQGGKTCPQIDSKKGSSARCLGPGLSRVAALAQDYRTVGWRRINKVRMTVSSSPPRPWRRLRGLSVVLPRDQAASDSGQNPFTQAAVIKIWNADVELGYFGLHSRGWTAATGRKRCVKETKWK